TPNDAFFVRWHESGIPTSVDLRTFRLDLAGHVDRPLSLSVEHLRKDFEPVSLIAVAQCSGNSRGVFQPRVAGGQWGNGAVGNGEGAGGRAEHSPEAGGGKGRGGGARLRGPRQTADAGYAQVRQIARVRSCQ